MIIKFSFHVLSFSLPANRIKFTGVAGCMQEVHRLMISSSHWREHRCPSHLHPRYYGRCHKCNSSWILWWIPDCWARWWFWI